MMEDPGNYQDIPGFPDLKLCSSLDKGRKLVVKRACKAGEVLLKQQPYAACLSEDQPRCDHCLKPSSSLQRCGRCKQAKYCSREHQRQAWQAMHAKECIALCVMHPRVPPPTVRLVARALWRAQGEAAATAAQEDRAGEADAARMHSGTGASAASQGGSWHDVQGLVHHWEHLQDWRKALYAQMASLTRQFAICGLTGTSAPKGGGSSVTASDVGDATLPSVGEIALLLARLAANAHTICDEELRPVGSGLYPLASMANHSCQPSAMQSFEGGTMVFRALRPLAPGNEVSIAYVELAATRQDRREVLFEQYAFDINAPVPPANSNAACGGLGQAARGMQEGQWQAELPLQQQQQQQQQQRKQHVGVSLRPPPLAETSISLGDGDGCVSQPSFLAFAPAAPAGSAGAGPAGAPDSCSSSGSALRTRVYSLCWDPPWAQDTRDGALTQLVLLPQPSGQEALAGGLHAGGCGRGAAAGAGAGPGHGRGEVLPGGVQAHCSLRQAEPAQDPAESFGGFGGWGDEEAEEGVGIGGQQQQQQQQQWRQQRLLQQQRSQRRKRRIVEVDVWGPWAAASTASFQAGLPGQGLPGQGLQGGATAAAAAAAPAQRPASSPHLQGGAGTLSSQQGLQQWEASAPHSCSTVPPSGAQPPAQLQLDVHALAMELGALEALVVHAESLMAQGPSSQAVQLLIQALARADGFAVPCMLPSTAAAVAAATAAPPPSPAAAPLPPCPPTSEPPAVPSLPNPPQALVRLALGPLHGLRVRLAATLLRAAVEEGSSWPVALQAARLLTPLYEQLYPPIWPNLGLHLAQHAKLAMFLEHASEAAEVANRALRILCITHAGQGGVCDEVARIRWEAQQEVAARGA